MLKLFLLLLIINSSINICETGCLKCDKENNCVFCDFSKRYKLNLESKNCEIDSSQEDCEYMDPFGKCKFCDKDFYLENNSKKCVEVPENSLIDNCLYYTSSIACEKCRRNFYLQGNTCQEIEKTIENCEFYLTQNICLDCEVNYIVSIDGKTCIESPNASNCSNYSRLNCLECDTGFFNNFNNFNENLYKFNTDENKRKIADHINEVTLGKPILKNTIICQKLIDKNCDKPLSANECEKCKPGFIVDKDKKCQKYPEEAILNCKLYAAIDQCKECTPGYWLYSNNICEPVENIPNCNQYDGAAKSSTCMECEVGFFSEGSSCGERILSKEIEFCKVFDNMSDKCKMCEDSYFLASDGLNCFKGILNCLEHVNSTSDVTCKVCSPGFYLKDDKNCLEGKIPNCSSYRNREDDCGECLNSYYLQNKKCEKHDSISKCDIFSKTEANTCLKCSDTFHNFKITKTCKFYSPINNCLEYENFAPLSCKKCELNYELKNPTSCQLIDLPNCVKYEGSICTACAPNFALDDSESSGNPKCSLIYSYQSTNCALTSVAEPANSFKMDEAYCKQCNSFYYPIDHRQQFVCISNDQLPSLSIKVTKLIQYCIKYNSARECIQCESDKFITKEHECVNICTSGSYRTLKHTKIGSGSSMKIVFDGYKECSKEDDEEKEIFSFDLSMENENELDIAIKCKDDRMPIIYILNGNYSNVNYLNSPKDYMKNFMVKKPGIITCKQPTTNSPLIPDCEYYSYVKIDGVSTYIRCLKCKHGYNSIISKDNKESSNTNSKSYFLNTCKKDISCRLVEKQGLDLIWTKFFSCHQCGSSSQIPFLAITHKTSSIPEPETFLQYSLDSINHITSPNTNRKNIECFEDSISTFGYDSGNSNEVEKYQKLPENCGLGVLNLSNTDGDASKNRLPVSGNPSSLPGLAQYCAACKPGYKATPINANSEWLHIKVECTRIENCSGTDWFNYCSQCNLNYAYNWANNEVDFAKCVSHDDNNCFAVENKICKGCKAGFNLNKDNFCESFNPPNCKSNEYFNIRKEYLNKKNIIYGLYHDFLGIGCNECTSGYTAIELTSSSNNPFVCVNSNYLQQQTVSFPNNTNFIKYCENYGINQESIRCEKCLDNYVLSEDNLKCYNGPSGCEISESDSKCIKCKLDYVIVNNECKSADILFCKEHNRDQNAPNKRCSLCDPDYYLTNEYLCEEGEVKHCEIYVNSQKNKCEKCKEGFAKFKNNESDYCFKINSSLNCKNANLSTSNIYRAELECTECNQSNELLTTLESDIKDKTICMEFNSIINCKKYEIGNSLANSTFFCVKCEENYYKTSETNCTKRKFISTDCEIYKDEEDRCETCNEEYFINNLGQCNPKPTGISNCTSYSDLTTCDGCKSEYYLEGSECKSIVTVIDGCEIYLDGSNCKKCKTQYFLDGNTCVAAKATNCETYLSLTACDTCPKGYGKKESSSLTNCSIINKPNCLDFEQDGPYLCLKCREGYYVDEEGNCTLANPVIIGCEFYTNNDDCSGCKKGYTLSENKKKCIIISQFQNKSIKSNKYDSNCLRYREEVTCSICRPGSVFDENGTCVECDDPDKCFKCNPKNRTECYLCLTDYYMDSNNKCNIIITQTKTPTKVEFSGMLQIFIHIFLIVFFLP